MGILYFVILLSIIAVVHEFGHLIAAKIFNVYCPEFSLGMGPKLFGKKIGETTYNVRAFPIGGFVAMAGDNENDLETKVSLDGIKPERILSNIAKWKRIIIMLAGVFMNFILALIIVSSILLYNGTYTLKSPAIVDGVVENSPASIAGFEKGDKIIKITFGNDTEIKPKNFDDILAFSQITSGESVYRVLRNNEEIDITVTPILNEETSAYYIGILIPKGEVVEINIWNCFNYGIDYLAQTTKTLLVSLSQLFVGRGVENLSGPVGIYTISSQAAKQGPMTYLLLIALISLNVGIVNLLPLPVLDGGRVLLTIVEIIIGRPLDKKVEMALMSISMILLLMLILFSTYQDILRLF